MLDYTKGDWKVRTRGITYQIYIETPSKPRAKEYQIAEGIYRKGNAHLIVAAPEMYETGLQLLEVMCELCRRLNPQHATCQSCEEIEGYRKAFAKAEGK